MHVTRPEFCIQLLLRRAQKWTVLIYRHQKNKSETEQKCCVLAGVSALPNVELEGLETAANSGTTGAFPSSPLLSHKNVNTSLTEAANALGASIRLLEEGQVVTRGAVNLRIL